MTKEQEIDLIIADDKMKWNNSPYPDEFPEWLLANFADILMGERQNVNPYPSGLIRSILRKVDGSEKLNMIEAGFVLNVYSSVNPYLIAKDIDEYLDKKEIYEQMMFKYNKTVENDERKMAAKRSKLLETSRSRIISR